MANSQNLEDMKLPELRELAKQMGLRGTSTMRKPALLATLQAARSGGEAPAGVTVRAPKTASKTAATNAPETTAEPAAQDQLDLPVSATEAAAPVEIPVPAEQAAAGSLSDSAESTDENRSAAKADRSSESVASAEPAAPAAGARRTRRKAINLDDVNLDGIDPVADRRRDDAQDEAPRRKMRKRSAEEMSAKADDLLATLDLGTDPADRRRERRDNRRNNGEELPGIRRVRDDEGEGTRRRRRPADDNIDAVRDLDDILATLPSQKHTEPSDEGEAGEEREFTRRTRNRDRGVAAHDERADRHNRRMRGRDAGDDDRRRDDRDIRDTRDTRDNRREEPAEDMVPVAGIVDVLDSYAFVRTSGYLPGPNDVYVSMGQVKKYGLRKGDAVHGTIRAPRENDRRNQRQKFVPLQAIDSINGMSVEEAMNRPQFSKLTPLYPQERLKQETTANKLTGRIMDIVSPIGKGQRGLIVSPPKAGKTITLQNIANSITANNPEVHLMVVLVDERPEEVTDMERTVAGEVISSTFDRPASDHTTVAELAIERAKRLVELGQDVVVLLDSMTRLARAYNIAAPASGRILSGGVDAQALYPPKKFFGAARNIENGGSLTIISSALVETGSKMDEVIFEEFKGTGNMELRLSRELADKRLFPAIDINASGTRREELITNPSELPVIYRLRRLLGGMEPEQAYQTLVPRLKKTATNRDFLAAIVQQANAGNATNGN
ncbi:transcription termination factor Rho [Bifidobacterium oedipodis]|uniref:transcription termination factor Rho n=1 Tax=Bifidobacterium oedipodis TaxID=2675322 RepID=UPI002FF8844D